MKNWVAALRPKTLFASMGPVILGLSLVWSNSSSLNFIVAIGTLFCAILLQMASNLANDYYDGISGVDNEDRLGPTRAIHAGLISHDSMKKALFLIFGLILLLGLGLMYRGGTPIIMIGLASMFFAWAYTGGPFPLSRYGLGEVFAFIFFGPVAVWGTFFLQTLEHSNEALILGAGPGFLSATLMAINNVRDRESDKASGRKTLAVLFPFKAARFLPHVFLLLGLAVPFYFMAQGHSALLLLSLLPQLLFIQTWKNLITETPSKLFNDYLANTGKCLFLHCLAFSALLVWTT